MFTRNRYELFNSLKTSEEQALAVQQERSRLEEALRKQAELRVKAEEAAVKSAQQRVKLEAVRWSRLQSCLQLVDRSRDMASWSCCCLL